MTKRVRFALLGAVTALVMPLAPTISAATEMPVPAPKHHYSAPRSHHIPAHSCGDAQDCAKGQDCVAKGDGKICVWPK
jgi:hypothetical protein